MRHVTLTTIDPVLPTRQLDSACKHGIRMSESRRTELAELSASATYRPSPASMTNSPGRNYYELLQIPHTASPAEIKASYHRLLLSHHPDKSDLPKVHPARMDVDIGRLKDAFITLFSPESRIKYDSELSSRPDLSESSRSRPAHIVSLEDFKDLGQFWTFNCRCGGQYTIGEEDMEKGVHLITCSSCSEVIWVGYEACPSEDDSTNSGGPQP